MTACEPLCALFAGGAGRIETGFGPLFPLFGERTLPILGSLRGTKEKAAGYVFVKQKIYR